MDSRPAGLKNDAPLSHGLEAISGDHYRRSSLIARRRVVGKLALVAVPNGRGRRSKGKHREYVTRMKGF
jgi:hypothetical protein